MAIKRLKQTGEDNQGNFNVMDGLAFARALNNNADELGTTTKVDLAVHNTPEALRKAMKEQSGKIGFHTPGGPDDLSTSEQTVSIQKGGVAQIYNEALEPEPEPEPASPEVTLDNPINREGGAYVDSSVEDLETLIDQSLSSEDIIPVKLTQVGNNVIYEAELLATSETECTINMQDELEGTLALLVDTNVETGDKYIKIVSITGYDNFVYTDNL